MKAIEEYKPELEGVLPKDEYFRIATGLRVCASEKKARKLACGVESDTFSGPV